jgi:hypothetical protein
VPRPETLNRRSVLLGVALAAGLGGAGCSGSGRRLGDAPGGPPLTAKTPARPAVPELVDRTLRSRAVSQQQLLLAACAAPAGQEPFATLRALHLAHLHRLTDSAPKPLASASRNPVAATLATAEHAAASQLRADCLRASPKLAPLLASLAASSEVAAFLLTP